MYLRLLILFLLFTSFISAQNQVADTTRKRCVTPVGKPFGDISSAKMGSNGGAIKSADKKLEVIFPLGALETETNVSVQSISNELTDDNAGAYQLEPSGLRFKKPVQLIFHYTNEDETADLSGIGTQNEKGEWAQLKKVTKDSIEKTISGFVSHFSFWALIKRFVLKPRKTVVETNGTVNLYVIQYPPPSDDDIELTDVKVNGQSVDGPDDGLVQLTETKINGVSVDDDLLATPLNKFSVLNWNVNDIQGGNSEIGTAAGNKMAVYKAPASVPSQNPVAVTAKVKVWGAQGTRTFSLTSKIKIIGDKYHFTYIHVDENGCYFLIDSSSCIVTIKGTKATLSNIINYRPWSDWPNCGNCKYEWTNKETILGLVQISGMANSSVTQLNDATSSVRVFAMLAPAIGNTPSAIVTCPKSPQQTIPSMPVPADPKYISFDIAGEDDITIHFGNRSAKNELVIEGKKEKTMIYVFKTN